MLFFFFKQKTAYDVRISDWSSDVCSSDLAWRIGPPPARDSYLCIERLIDIARTGGAEAIHPGYGFLSENADFAEACADAGVVFIGPPADAIRAMGSKSAAKRIMEIGRATRRERLGHNVWISVVALSLKKN